MIYLSQNEYDELKKNNREAWLKYCYDLCNECKWVKEAISRFSKKYDYTSDTTLIEAGKKYASEYLHLSKEEIASMIKNAHNNTSNTRYNDLLKKIIELKDPNEIAELFEKESYIMSELINKIDTYIRIHRSELSIEEQKKLAEEIRAKIKPIQEKIKLKQKKINKYRIEIEEIKRDIATLNLFIEVIKGKLTEKELLYKIGKSRFNRCLELLKDIDIDFYNEYIKAVERQIETQQKENNEIKKMINEIINYLQNGIETENGLREFDVIDFYLLYSKYSNEIQKQIKNCDLTKNERTLISKFINQNINPLINKRINTKCIIEGTDIIYLEDGSGNKNPKEIKKPEKILLFEYLKSNNIPATDKTYKAMINRYKIELQNEERRKKGACQLVKKLTQND